MGGLKSWFKRATKIPKAIRKLQPLKVIASAAKGLVTGGIIGAVGGAGGEVNKQSQERAAEAQMKAEAAAAQAQLDMQAQTIPAFSQGNIAEKPTPAVPVIPGIEVISSRTFVMIGLVLGAGILVFMLTRRR